MLCLASILLSRPYVVWVYSMYAVEVGLSLVLAVRVTGSMARINTPTFSNLVILHNYPPTKMEQTERSEMSAYKIQTPGNYREECIRQGNISSANE